VAVLLRLKEWGYTGLPVHDCLIVPRSQAFDIQNLMEQASVELLNIEIPVNTDRGGSRTLFIG
jgi:hypothetical protein